MASKYSVGDIFKSNGIGIVRGDLRLQIVAIKANHITAYEAKIIDIVNPLPPISFGYYDETQLDSDYELDISYMLQIATSASLPYGTGHFKFSKGDVLKESGYNTSFRYKVMRTYNSPGSGSDAGDKYELERQPDGPHEFMMITYGKVFVECSFELVSSNGCFHEWKTYHGFNVDWDYCGKCDVKRAEDRV